MTEPVGAVVVVGLGSPFGDDRAGWRVAEALRDSLVLQAHFPDRLAVALCERPDRLPELLRGAARAIVVDAVRSGAPPGTQHRVTDATMPLAGRTLSTHGLDVASVLALARALGELPPMLELRGIEAGDAAGADLSPAVETAVIELAGSLEQELCAWFSARPPGARRGG